MTDPPRIPLSPLGPGRHFPIDTVNGDTRCLICGQTLKDVAALKEPCPAAQTGGAR